MLIADLDQIEGQSYPARRRAQPLAGTHAPIPARHFALACITLDPRGGQIPWQNQKQEAVFLILEGKGEMCLGDEVQSLREGQAVHIPAGVYHQISNMGDNPLRMISIHGQEEGEEADRHALEIEGGLPRAGIEAPPLSPEARYPQCTDTPLAAMQPDT